MVLMSAAPRQKPILRDMEASCRDNWPTRVPCRAQAQFRGLISYCSLLFIVLLFLVLLWSIQKIL